MGKEEWLMNECMRYSSSKFKGSITLTFCFYSTVSICIPWAPSWSLNQYLPQEIFYTTVHLIFESVLHHYEIWSIPMSIGFFQVFYYFLSCCMNQVFVRTELNSMFNYINCSRHSFLSWRPYYSLSLLSLFKLINSSQPLQ